ncbi:MAG: hypothetical protein WCF23_11640 [Candidatus Nitrosopolaris sp.]
MIVSELMLLSIVKEYEMKNIIKDFNMYLFELNNTPCILFNRFLGAAHFEGLRYEQIHTTIPDFIREKFGELKA